MEKPYHKQSSSKDKNTAMNKPKTTAAKKPAAKKTTAKKPENKPAETKKSFGAVFWAGFFIIVIILFIYNRDNISRTISESRNSQNRTLVMPPESELPENEITIAIPIPAPPASAIQPPASPVESSGQPQQNPAETTTQQPGETQTVQSQVSEQPTAAQQTPQQSTAQQQTTQSATPQQSAPQGTAPQGTAPQSAATAPVYRDRPVYFINVDRDGTIIRTRVNRSLPVTESPLTDTISALLEGPVPDEQRRGMISLIPEGTRIMSAAVRGSTAYLSFSEDFQFNTYGVEGYAAALRQVVWTATEFSNVRDVQILIEGRRIDFLGEGVWIGSPVSRDNF